MATEVDRLEPGMIVRYDDVPTPMLVEAVERFEGYIVIWSHDPNSPYNGWDASLDMRILTPGELVR